MTALPAGLHIVRVDRLNVGPLERDHPRCSCDAVFEYVSTYGEARMALDAHIDAVHGLVPVGRWAL